PPVDQQQASAGGDRRARPAEQLGDLVGRKQVLAKADPRWLRSLITRRVPLDDFAEALTAHDDDIKVVLDLSAEGR
ncbi:hypothetical protein AB0C31_38320, partial [Actinoplanes philippinensis]